MIKRYTKRPVTVATLEWDGTNIDEMSKFLEWRNFDHDERNGLVIRTLEGCHHASIGDIIIRGVQGEFYPCKPDIFHATYVATEENK